MVFGFSAFTGRRALVAAIACVVASTAACTGADDTPSTRLGDDVRIETPTRASTALTLENSVLIATPGVNTFDIDTLLSTQGSNLDSSTFALTSQTTEKGQPIQVSGNTLSYDAGATPLTGWDRFSYEVCDHDNDCGVSSVQIVIQGGSESCSTLTLEETFRNSTADGTWTYKDNGTPVVLTAAQNIDTEGDGWLRLTPITAKRAGAALYDEAFYSHNGVSISFETTSWGGRDEGGDGLLFFLVDGDQVDSSNFELGGCCGSLGYAPFENSSNTPPFTPGMAHAVAGIAFDHWGGFWNGDEGRTGPDDTPNATSERPNSIVVRADAANDWKTLFVDEIDPSTLEMSCSSNAGCTDRPEELGPGRYNVSVVITPVDNGNRFQLNVFIQSSANDSYIQIADTIIEQALPEQLKLGFIGSSGGSLTAYHEVRNVTVQSLVDAQMNVSVSPAPIVPGEAVTYTYTVRNSGNHDICAADIQLVLPDGFETSSQSCQASSPNSDCGRFNEIGALQDVVPLGANDTITIEITGIATDPGDGTPAQAGGSVTPVDGQSDETPNNNSSSVDTSYQISSSVKDDEDEVWVLTGTPNVPIEIISSQPSNITNIQGPVSGGTAHIDPNDPSGLIFTPDDENQTGSYEIIVESCADANPSNCSQTTVTIVYNDPPTLDDDAIVISPNSTHTINIVDNADPGDYGTIDPSSLTLTQGATTPNGSCTIQSGSLTFSANANASIGAIDSCTVTICEEQPTDACTEATYTFEIQEAFTPHDDQIDGARGKSSTVSIQELLSNDGNVDDTTFQLVPNSATGGSVRTEGNDVIFDTDAQATSAAFEYEICSGLPADTRCETVTVTVRIHDEPSIDTTGAWTLENTPVTLPPVVDPSMVNTVVNVDGGNAIIDPSTGQLQVTPAPGFLGDLPVTIESCTPTTPAACTEETLIVTVNDLPTLDDEHRIVTPGGTQTIDVVASADPGTVGALDPNSAQLTSNTTTANGSCTLTNGKLTFAANADATIGASDICTVEVCEERPVGACTSATYTFEIQDVFNPTEDELSTTQNVPFAFEPNDLLQNDGNTKDGSFQIKDEDPENPGTYTTEEGGTITWNPDDQQFVYTPPEDFTGEDGFSYNVCSGLPGQDTHCEDVTVTIVINDPPSIDSTTIWVVTDTPSVDVDLNDLYTGGPIGNITPGAVEDEDGNAVGTIAIDPQNQSLTFTPNDPSTPATYDFTVEVCDQANVCEDAAITIVYNDPPNTEDPGLLIEPGTNLSTHFDTLIRNSDTGDINGGWDETSITVSSDPNGPFGTTADLDGDNHCAIVNGELVYTLHEDVPLGDQAPTCFVQICEQDPGPVGVVATDRACSNIPVVPTAGIGVVITGPEDGSTIGSDDPVTVTGTGEPNTEISVSVDGTPVGTTTVDEDGNWELPLTDPLSPGEHTITAESDNGSKDEVTVNVKDPNAELVDIVINGPADGATVPTNTVIYGKAEPFTPVKIFVDGTEVGTTNADGKGAWTFDLNDLTPGEHTLTAEDRNGNQDKVTVTVKEDDDGNGEGNDDGLEGADPNVALTGGRFLSCASTGTSSPSTGLVLLTLGVGIALARRRKTFRR